MPSAAGVKEDEEIVGVLRKWSLELLEAKIVSLEGGIPEAEATVASVNEDAALNDAQSAANEPVVPVFEYREEEEEEEEEEE